MSTKASEFEQRAVEAAARFLERKGYRVLGNASGECVNLVARDGSDTVFVGVVAGEAGGVGLPVGGMDREAAEADALAWLGCGAESIPEGRIRFDEVALAVIDGGRAMIRHHVNVLGEA